MHGYMSRGYDYSMVSLAEKIPVDEITAIGRAAPGPGRTLVTAVLGVFWLAGWLTGRSWLVITDFIIATRVGYWRGRGLTAGEAVQRVIPPKPAPGPA